MLKHEALTAVLRQLTSGMGEIMEASLLKTRLCLSSVQISGFIGLLAHQHIKAFVISVFVPARTPGMHSFK